MSKPIYRIVLNDFRQPGDTNLYKEWEIFVGGKSIGNVTSHITHLNYNPNRYSVYVAASVNGEQIFVQASRGFILTMRDAKWERSRFMEYLKAAVTRHEAKRVDEHK